MDKIYLYSSVCYLIKQGFEGFGIMVFQSINRADKEVANFPKYKYWRKNSETSFSYYLQFGYNFLRCSDNDRFNADTNFHPCS